MTRKQYDDLEATELYCPQCRACMPVRKRLLLHLPNGDKYDYLCTRCGASVGDKMDKEPDRAFHIIV